MVSEGLSINFPLPPVSFWNSWPRILKGRFTLLSTGPWPKRERGSACLHPDILKNCYQHFTTQCSNPFVTQEETGSLVWLPIKALHKNQKWWARLLGSSSPTSWKQASSGTLAGTYIPQAYATVGTHHVPRKGIPPAPFSESTYISPAGDIHFILDLTGRDPESHLAVNQGSRLEYPLHNSSLLNINTLWWTMLLRDFFFHLISFVFFRCSTAG